mmetsp:Transcript_3866/g.5661  ORF Transcript_3866/g.5661 Transcript_3866/m.5661 type:complete len:84 (+) Transcript_3866:426-677(+)
MGQGTTKPSNMLLPIKSAPKDTDIKVTHVLEVTAADTMRSSVCCRMPVFLVCKGEKRDFERRRAESEYKEEVSHNRHSLWSTE